MARRTRSDDWGFPRWRPYGAGEGVAAQRRCDREGCDQPGLHPAPKAPNRPERWWFCAAHAAEYNARWDYFAGLDADSAAEHAREQQRAAGWARARHWSWTEDGLRPRAERAALRALELDEDADWPAIRAAWRRLAKAHHPDANPGDPAARARFEAVTAAYELLERAATGAGETGTAG